MLHQIFAHLVFLSKVKPFRENCKQFDLETNLSILIYHTDYYSYKKYHKSSKTAPKISILALGLL